MRANVAGHANVMANNTAKQSLAYYSSVRTEIEGLLPESIDSILEIGCGAGSTMAWIRSTRAVNYAAGVEINATAGAVARQIFDSVEIGSIDNASFPFAAGKFDVILALDVLEHLPSPDCTIRMLRSKLLPGGRLIASIPNVANYSVSWPLFLRGRWDYADEGHLDRTHLRFFDRNGAISLFIEAGFTIDKIETTKKCPNVFGIFGWNTPNARWYSRKLLAHVLPSHMCDSQFIIVGRPFL